MASSDSVTAVKGGPARYLALQHVRPRGSTQLRGNMPGRAQLGHSA